eukprot:IDg9073t1
MKRLRANGLVSTLNKPFAPARGGLGASPVARRAPVLQLECYYAVCGDFNGALGAATWCGAVAVAGVWRSWCSESVQGASPELQTGSLAVVGCK